MYWRCLLPELYLDPIKSGDLNIPQPFLHSPIDCLHNRRGVYPTDVDADSTRQSNLPPNTPQPVRNNPSWSTKKGLTYFDRGVKNTGTFPFLQYSTPLITFFRVFIRLDWRFYVKVSRPHVLSGKHNGVASITKKKYMVWKLGLLA